MPSHPLILWVVLGEVVHPDAEEEVVEVGGGDFTDKMLRDTSSRNPIISPNIPGNKSDVLCSGTFYSRARSIG